MAVHGGPVSDRDNSGHGHCVDHKIIQETALGIFIHIYIRLLSTYISDQKMCTMHPFIWCKIFFNRKNSFAYTEVYIRTFWAKAQFKLCSTYAVLWSRNFVRDHN